MKGTVIKMTDYTIFTDSACDMSPDILSEWGVKYRSLSFRFDGDEAQYIDGAVPAHEFYDRMRQGDVIKTAAVNAQSFVDAFEAELKEGKDILYLGFSSGLSSTYAAGKLAAEQLKEEYPERKIIAIDTLSASAGFGLLLKLAVDKKAAGATIEENAQYVEDTKLHLCHWFTVDDLVYLKRGGRISPTLAFVGNVLGIKPVLHMDNEGHLINITKVRGRKTSIAALADKLGELAYDTSASSPVFVSHGDCPEDIELLDKMLREKYGRGIDLSTNVGTVIGAHSGPGTIALFFLGKER